MPLFMGENEGVFQKVESAYMNINRLILGGNNWMTNKTKICSEIKVDPPRQLICKAALRFIHKHLIKKTCGAIINQLSIPKRSVSMIYVKDPQSGTYHASIDRIIEVYNKLPTKVKEMSIGQFKKYLQKNEVKTW